MNVTLLRAARRTYASAALKLNLTLPHKTLLKETAVKQVNLSSSEGDLGILADHVPTVAQLLPGIIDVFPEESGEKNQKFFVSAGFAVINKNSVLNVNCVEACTLDEIDYDAAKRAAEDANRRAINTSLTDVERATAKIELEVYSAIELAHKATR